MKRFSISPRLLIGLAIIAFIAISLLFRIALPYNQIFVDDWVKFASSDSYSFMRMVDNWVYNFPHVTSVDVYRIYPGDPGTIGFSFFNLLIAFIAWVIGLGSPSQHVIDVVGVCFPAVLAALTIIPAYFIGRTLFNRWAGLLAAGLMAVMPGEFMSRTFLGFTDPHAAETLFSMTAMLFLILAIKTASERNLTFEHILRRDFKTALRPLVYGLLGGIFLSIYLISWQGAPLFIFIIVLYFIIQFIIDHLRKKSTDYLGIIGFVLFFISFIICWPFSLPRFEFIAMFIAILIPPVLSGISRLLSARGLKPFYYPLILVGLGAVFIAVFYAITPDTLNTMLERFKFVFMPGGSTAATTSEMGHLLSPFGYFTTELAWGSFTTSFFLVKSWPIPGFGLIALVILIWLYIKNRGDNRHWLLFFVWTLVILVATLVQRRFCYYLVVNLSLLTAYIAWQIIWQAGLKKLTVQTEGKTVAAKSKPEKKKHQQQRAFSVYHINVILAIIVVFFLVFFWNITRAKETASHVYYAPSDAWVSSLDWMRDNTPDPFGDLDVYYGIYKPVPGGPNFIYPESAYGVTAWWDYGYWISRIARRLPNANPGQEPEPIKKVAKFFLSQDDATRSQIRAELGSSYIIIDYSLVLWPEVPSKFWAVLDWAGTAESEFAGTYYVLEEDQLYPVTFLYPEYYRTLVVRLYAFNGESVTDVKPLVITYEEKTDSQGIHYRQITDANEFSSYQEALDFVVANGSANNIIVGQDPFTSPIPLEALPDYKIVYSSNTSLNAVNIPDDISEVKIFQYTGSD